MEYVTQRGLKLVKVYLYLFLFLSHKYKDRTHAYDRSVRSVII